MSQKKTLIHLISFFKVLNFPLTHLESKVGKLSKQFAQIAKRVDLEKTLKKALVYVVLDASALQKAQEL